MPKEAPRWVDRDLMSVAGGMAFGLFLLFLVVSGSGYGPPGHRGRDPVQCGGARPTGLKA
jgi:hypothetical protein